MYTKYFQSYQENLEKQNKQTQEELNLAQLELEEIEDIIYDLEDESIELQKKLQEKNQEL